MYFRGANLWQQLCTPMHNNQSTVRHKDDKLELKFSEGFPPALFRNFSPLRFDEPFFYGRFRKHVFIVMIDRREGVRMTHSPSGGGVNSARQTTNPAWDLQFIIPRYEVRKSYGFKLRAVYREECGRDDILKEFANWTKAV